MMDNNVCVSTHQPDVTTILCDYVMLYHNDCRTFFPDKIYISFYVFGNYVFLRIGDQQVYPLCFLQAVCRFNYFFL